MRPHAAHDVLIREPYERGNVGVRLWAVALIQRPRMLLCDGQLVTARAEPGVPEFRVSQIQAGQDSNTFGKIQNVEGNWKDLLIAYLYAGVDVGDEFPAWVAYLEQLGAGATGTQGPHNIYDIAQARNTALIGNLGMDTNTRGGGGPVHTRPGSGSNPTTIEFTLPAVD